MSQTVLGAAEAIAAMRTGRVQARDLVEACLHRIDDVNETVNAFVRLDSDSARGAAHAPPGAGALAGLPCAHKDMFHRAGCVSTYGSAAFASHVANETATVLHRLDEAGALDLGTLHMAEVAHGSTGHNAWLGAARNPWNSAHITGGSSSGPAAAVAARMVYAALGSDTGGSIRMPAHFCGVTGLKPTHGLVSRGGCMPLSYSLDTIGPLAAGAVDVALLLEQLVGADPRDPTAESAGPTRYLAASEDPIGGRVIGVPQSFYIDELSPAVARALEATIERFEKLGATIVSVSLPPQEPLTAGQLVLVASEACNQYRAFFDDEIGFEPQIRNRLLNGFGYGAQEYLDALRGRGPALAQHLRATEGIDALLTPVVPFEAPTIAETDVGGGPDAEAMIRRISRLMRPANYLGLPAMAFPAGFAGRLPVGLQLVGRPFAENTLFALVGAFQRATDYHRKDPFN